MIRYHPAVIAEAAATAAELSGGRFFLGVGTGEALNEHITGDRWPPADVRQDMLVEAIEIIRELWTGETVDYEGDFYVVENARLFSCHRRPPQIFWAAAGESLGGARRRARRRVYGRRRPRRRRSMPIARWAARVT